MSRRSKSSMSKKTKITIGAAVAIFVVAGGGSDDVATVQIINKK